jgi:predicted Rossmann fold flavoprotein
VTRQDVSIHVVPTPPHFRVRSLPPTVDVAVVGAGAAGLVAAIFAAGGARSEQAPSGATTRQVLVIERTRDGGRKILISGGGRCNVLPSVLAPERFVTDSSPNTLRNLLRSWPLDGQRTFFEQQVGVPLALEAETGKLFPVSDRARDVRDGLVRLARQLGVSFRFDTSVTDVQPDADGAWRLTLGPRGSGPGVSSGDRDTLRAKHVIVATGGLSVPATGSDGTGLTIADRLGHAVHATYAALTPLVAEPPLHTALSGVSLTARLRVATNAGGRAMDVRGGFLFTHRGYSGPVVLDVSHHAVRARQRGETQPILVQWAEPDEGAWREALQHGDGLAVSRLRERLPQRLADHLLAEAGVPLDRTLATLRREERTQLVAKLCHYELPWTGDEGYKKAEVTGGGVSLAEVDPRTLESHRRPGLFFCGEILDAFGPIGGHNFAWAWATGRLAGLGARRAVTSDE